MSDAQFMGFPSKQEADAAFKETYTKALMKRSLSKSADSSKSKNSSKKVTSPQYTAERNEIAEIQIYCDGACSPNPGKSGSGMAVYQNKQLTSLWYGLHESHGTNNTAELNALLEALKLAKTTIANNQTTQILSDSKYSIDCITKWAKGWKNKGWTRGKGEEIKNLEIIKTAFTLYESIKNDVIISHVKGHANIEGNELSDRMAVLARIEAKKGFISYTKTLDIKTILAMASG
jgi:ribonuclease HI